MIWNDNIYIKEFIKETRTSGTVTSLTIKCKVYKKDALPTVAGDGNMLSYNDQTMTVKTRSGKNYYNFNSATALVEKSFTYTVPSDEQTTETQSSDLNAYFAKYKQWHTSYQDTSAYETCYNALWTDLEALDVSW